MARVPNMPAPRQRRLSLCFRVRARSFAYRLSRYGPGACLQLGNLLQVRIESARVQNFKYPWVSNITKIHILFSCHLSPLSTWYLGSLNAAPHLSHSLSQNVPDGSPFQTSCSSRTLRSAEICSCKSIPTRRRRLSRNEIFSRNLPHRCAGFVRKIP